MQTNAAYDLERFAPREQKPRLRVAGQPKPKRGLARYNLNGSSVAFASVFLALVCSVLYSQVQSTELSARSARRRTPWLTFRASIHTWRARWK